MCPWEVINSPEFSGLIRPSAELWALNRVIWKLEFCFRMKRLSIHIKRCRKENHTETSIESCQLCKQVCTGAHWNIFETIPLRGTPSVIQIFTAPRNQQVLVGQRAVRRKREFLGGLFQVHTSVWKCTDERYALILVYCIVLLPC